MPTLKSRMKTSLQRAHRVLELVKLDGLTKDEREEIIVTTYENCREAGYAASVKGLVDIDIKVVWAECRGSDEVVVYVGKAKDFELYPYGNVPNEYVYEEHCHRFSAKRSLADGERQAAAFIQKMLVPQAKAARREMDAALAAKKSA